MLDLVLGHRFSDELDIDFFAFLEHPFGARGRAGVHIDLHVVEFLQNLVHRDHEATEEESWVIQINEDEPVGLLLLDGSADRVDSGLLKEGLITFESETLLEEWEQVRAGDEEALWVITDWAGLLRLCFNNSLVEVCSLLVHGIDTDRRWSAENWLIIDNMDWCGCLSCNEWLRWNNEDESAGLVLGDEVNWPSELS